MGAEMIKAILKYALGFYRTASSGYLELYLKMELANPKPLNKNKFLCFLKLFWLYFTLKLKEGKSAEL